MIETDVLVVGAGPVGLTLACDLARQGVACRIVDREPAPSRASKAKGIQPRSLEVLDDLGAVDYVLRHGVADLPMRFHQPSGDVDGASFLVRASDGFHTPYPDPLWIGQFDVEHALRERLGELGGRVEYGLTALALAQDEDGVTATLRTEAGERAIRARYLVGTDGGKSTIRHLIGVPMEGETREWQRWYLGDLTVTGVDRDHVHVWPSEAGMLVLTPLPNSDIFQLQVPVPADAEPEEPSLAVYQRLFDERQAGVTLTSATWLSIYRVNVRMATDYRSGRVFLAGDAAHVHSPAGGQGMNTGIQDAYNLGWKLGAVVRGADPALLDTYAAERMPVARQVLATSTAKFDRTAENMAGDIGDLSEALEGMIDDTLTTGLGIRYGSAAPGSIGPVAGDRAPNATGLAGGGLFDLIRGPQWNLIAFDNDDPAIAEGIDPARLRVHRIVSTEGNGILDRDGEFRRIYAPKPGELVLIRPDGYLAARGEVAEIELVIP